MKLLSAIATLLVFTSAHASYYATQCSNSNGSIKWESGHNANSLYYTGADSEVITVSYYDLEAKFSDEVIFREDIVQNCGSMSSTKVFAARVIFTPAEHRPNALDFLDGEKKIVTEVICTTEYNGRSGCP